MLETLFNWIRDFKEKIECKKCNYKSLFAINILPHWSKCYGVKPNKRDLYFLLKYNFVSRLIKFLIACILIPPLFIIKLICYLFIILDEII